MKKNTKKILALAVVAVIILLAYLSWDSMREPKTLNEILGVQFSEKDQKKAEELLDQMGKMDVYIERMDSNTVWGRTPEEKVKEIPGDLIGRARYVQDFTLWKGAYPSEITLTNGRTVTARVSCYGNFFAINGISGYFQIQESDWKEWEDAMGIEEVTLPTIETQ